jgi:hypothetical protein
MIEISRGTPIRKGSPMGQTATRLSPRRRFYFIRETG